ncbi:hypothetical protein D3C81_1801570 [compost metagenome]
MDPSRFRVAARTIQLPRAPLGALSLLAGFLTDLLALPNQRVPATVQVHFCAGKLLERQRCLKRSCLHRAIGANQVSLVLDLQPSFCASFILLVCDPTK